MTRKQYRIILALLWCSFTGIVFCIVAVLQLVGWPTWLKHIVW